MRSRASTPHATPLALAATAVALLAGCALSDDDPTLGSAAQEESAGGWLADGPAVASPAPHRYDVFVQGGGGVLYHRRLKDGVWNDYVPIGSGITSKPAAVSWGPGRVDVVAKGSDNTLWHWWSDDGDNYAGPESLGGTLIYGPAIASTQAGVLDIFAIGTDHQLFQKHYDGVTIFGMGWEAWRPRGGWISASPSAVAMDANNLDVFVRGGENGLWHRARRSGSWLDYEWLGGYLTSGPAAASYNPGRMEVYVRDGANQVAARTYSLIGWEDWKLVPVDGGVTSDPVAIADAGQLCDHVFFRQDDGSLGHRGCTDTSVVSLGGFQSLQGSYRTTTLPNALLAPWGTLTTTRLEGSWPRELIAFDRADAELSTTISIPAVRPGALERRYAQLPGWQHVSPGGFDLSSDFGPFVRTGTTPFAIQHARVIDHGACSIKQRWLSPNLVPPPMDPAFFGKLFGQLDESIKGGAPAGSSVSRMEFKLEPLFIGPTGTDTTVNHDGFALFFKYNIHTPTSWYWPDSDVEVWGWANYHILVRDGVLTLEPVGEVAGGTDSDFATSFADSISSLFGHPLLSGIDVRGSLSVDLPARVQRGYLDTLPTIGLCNAAHAPAVASAECVDFARTALSTDLQAKMVARGVPAASAKPSADAITAKLTAANFTCVQPAPDTAGQCRYHPAFRRVNVTPTGFELVVSESTPDPANGDEAVLYWESPADHAACLNSAPPPPATSLPVQVGDFGPSFPW